jgi:hypothetical protein
MKRVLYAIQDTTTGTFCNSSKSALFAGFEIAALFAQRANADAALKKLSRSVHCRILDPATGSYKSLGYPVLKIVPCTLSVDF